MVALPPGFERVTPQASTGKVRIPPGFERVPSSATAQNPQPDDVLPLPGTAPAQQPTRPPFPSTGTNEEFVANLGQALDRPVLDTEQYETLKALGPATLRTVGNNLLPSIVDPPTPEQGQMFDRMMIELLAARAGAGGGGMLTKAGAETLKGLGRAGMTRFGAERFMQSLPQYVVRAGEKARTGPVREFLSPALKGSLVGVLTDYADPSSWAGNQSEFVDNIAGSTVGAGVAGVGAREAAQNLLLRDPRWRDLVMRDPRGMTGKVLGALLGYLAAKAGEVSVETFDQAADYVANLFGSPDK